MAERVASLSAGIICLLVLSAGLERGHAIDASTEAQKTPSDGFDFFFTSSAILTQ